MRSEAERLKFCGDTTLAAKRLGIVIHDSGPGNETWYCFYDQATGREIRGEPLSDKKLALEDACDKLVEYLSGK